MFERSDNVHRAQAAIAGVALLVVCLQTAGCALGRNYERPAVQVPVLTRGQQGPADPRSLAELGWWELFADRELQALLSEALEANHDLRAAAARVEQARQLVAGARSELFPQIDAHGEAAREKGVTPAGKRTFSSYLATLNLAWEIDLWGRIRRLTEAAKAQFFAAEEVRRGVLLSLTSDVATSYFELVSLDLELAVARESTDTFRETSELFNHRFEGGIGTLLEVSRGKAALEGAEAQIPEIERQIVAKENQLCVLLGRAPGPVLRSYDLARPAASARIPVGLPSDLLERRPDLLEAEQGIVRANAEAGAALASFFPRIGLTSFYGGQSDDLASLVKHGSNIWSVGGTISAPLFQGGRLLATYRERNAELDEAIERYEQATLIAFGEVSSLLVSHEKLARVRSSRAGAVGQLETSVRLSLQRYKDGVASYFEVLEAQQQFFPSKLELVRIERDQLVTLVALYRALGGGWKLSNETAPAATPQAEPPFVETQS